MALLDLLDPKLVCVAPLSEDDTDGTRKLRLLF